MTTELSTGIQGLLEPDLHLYILLFFVYFDPADLQCEDLQMCIKKPNFAAKRMLISNKL